ncbi:MAG: DUF433 domain-containing protein [Acidobacteria bacterium]|nr:DUF433 domain-containing protein [Acidobacteriota bacterium]
MSTITPKKEVALEEIVWTDPERMSGAPCFYGTRVPIKNLFDYLEGGQSLETFLEDFEGVSREQADAVLRLAMDSLSSGEKFRV